MFCIVEHSVDIFIDWRNGMGVAIGDYDADGWQDILITGYGKLVLYHNNGNGTFSDVTAASGIQPLKWGTSAVWFDYDNDGKLDLFIGQFADYSEQRLCGLAESYGGGGAVGATVTKPQAYYCSPKIYEPLPSRCIAIWETASSWTSARVPAFRRVRGKLGALWRQTSISSRTCCPPT